MTVRILASLGLAAALAACDAPTTMPQHRASPLAWDSMMYAAGDSPILVEVAGAPFGGADGALAPRLAQAMTGAVFGYPARFTADPAQARHRNFRTVLVFAPAPGLTEEAVCAGRPAFLAGGAPGEVRLFGAFCNDARPLSYVTGRVSGVSSPDDPRFVGLVRAATRDLFRPPVQEMRNEIDLIGFRL